MDALRNDSGAVAKMLPLTFANFVSGVTVIRTQQILGLRDVWNLSGWVITLIRRIPRVFIHAYG